MPRALFHHNNTYITMKKHLGMLAAMMYAMADRTNDYPVVNAYQKREITPPLKIDGKKHTVIPKGCKRYTFNYEGKVFACIAMNQKSAFRKFQKWVREGGKP